MKSSFKLLMTAIAVAGSLTGCQKYLEWYNHQGSGSEECPDFGNYVAGDFHQHSTFTDGSWSLPYVMAKDNYYDLDWWANSEHGGGFTRDGRHSGSDMNNDTLYWDKEDGVTIQGTVKGDNIHQYMWRWQSIRDFAFPEVLNARTKYQPKVIIQGVEWNVPGHEHASVSIITNEFGVNPNANSVSEFEYRFDNNDADVTGGAAQGWIKSTNTGHAKTLEAISWLQTNHQKSSWVVPAHPERKSLYKISDFRDMNNAGPDVCFGFESMPGHQKVADRGEYKLSSKTYGECTYGGTGAMAAKVGGMWDAMLSEGRHWWLFANSDFHDIAGDFFPGEYQKTYVSVSKKGDAQSIVDGMRSGNVYVVEGNLIKNLNFTIGNTQMGETGYTSNGKIAIEIKIGLSDGLDHIDLIAGKLSGKIDPSDPKYNVDSVSTTSVIARFDSKGGVKDANGIVSSKWNQVSNVIYIKYELKLTGDMYFRLRGTNWGLNTLNQTDANGNPLPDKLEYPNDASKAMADRWFYSNPIWIKLKK